MNAVVIPVRVDKRGRLYPVTWQLPKAELNRVRWLEHDLVHRDGYSIRQCQAILLQNYGLRRSLGSIHADLQRFECNYCRREDESA